MFYSLLNKSFNCLKKHTNSKLLNGSVQYVCINQRLEIMYTLNTDLLLQKVPQKWWMSQNGGFDALKDINLEAQLLREFYHANSPTDC